MKDVLIFLAVWAVIFIVGIAFISAIAFTVISAAQWAGGG